MDLRLVLVSSLLLLGVATAQTQDPDKPQEAPAEVTKRLAAEKERLEREIAYVKERTKNAKALMAGRIAPAPKDYKVIDAGKSVTAIAAPVMPAQPRAARVATADELANQPEDVMLVVNGRPVLRAGYNQLVQFMAGTPASGDETMRTQRALYELIRIEAVLSSFEEHEAAEKVNELHAQLDAGKTMADLVKAVGTVPGAGPDGRIEVTRNSAFGPRLEQVAFTTEAGQRARAFKSANGIVLLQVEKVEKGASPELDKVIAIAVQVPYAEKPEALQKAHMAVNTGQLDILARDQATLDLLPEMFKQKAPAVQPAPVGPRLDAAEVQKRLDVLRGEMKALEGKTDEESKRKLQELQDVHAQLERALRSQDMRDDLAPPPPQKKDEPKKEEPKKEAPKKEAPKGEAPRKQG